MWTNSAIVKHFVALLLSYFAFKQIECHITCNEVWHLASVVCARCSGTLSC